MDIFELSYNPRDPLYDLPGLPGVRWGLIFTVNNLYQLDPAKVVSVTARPAPALRGVGFGQ